MNEEEMEDILVRAGLLVKIIEEADEYKIREVLEGLGNDLASGLLTVAVLMEFYQSTCPTELQVSELIADLREVVDIDFMNPPTDRTLN